MAWSQHIQLLEEFACELYIRQATGSNQPLVTYRRNIDVLVRF